MTTYRSELLDLLGSKCKICGITDPRVLQIDHIHGGGCREIRNSKGRKLRYYLEHPDEARRKLQVLCANHNWIKRHENKETKHGLVGEIVCAKFSPIVYLCVKCMEITLRYRKKKPYYCDNDSCHGKEIEELEYVPYDLWKKTIKLRMQREFAESISGYAGDYHAEHRGILDDWLESKWDPPWRHNKIPILIHNL